MSWLVAGARSGTKKSRFMFIMHIVLLKIPQKNAGKSTQSTRHTRRISHFLSSRCRRVVVVGPMGLQLNNPPPRTAFVGYLPHDHSRLWRWRRHVRRTKHSRCDLSCRSLSGRPQGLLSPRSLSSGVVLPPFVAIFSQTWGWCQRTVLRDPRVAHGPLPTSQFGTKPSHSGLISRPRQQ